MEQQKRHFPPPSDETRAYMQAVWDFIVEHSDLTERGAFFVKFHMSGKADFEKRVRARLNWGYHRIDERSGFNNRQKEADAAARRAAHEDKKAAKAHLHAARKKLGQEAMRKAVAEVAEANRKRREEAHIEQLAGITPLKPAVINTPEMQGVASPWYTRVKLWLKSKLQKHRHRLNASIVSLARNPHRD